MTLKSGYQALSKAPPKAVAASTIKEGKSLCYFYQLVTNSGSFQASWKEILSSPTRSKADVSYHPHTQVKHQFGSGVLLSLIAVSGFFGVNCLGASAVAQPKPGKFSNRCSPSAIIMEVCVTVQYVI